MLAEGWRAVDQFHDAERLVVLVHVQGDRLARGVQRVVSLDKRMQVMLGVEERACGQLNGGPMALWGRR